jgi:hypothetical protein
MIITSTGTMSASSADLASYPGLASVTVSEVVSCGIDDDEAMVSLVAEDDTVFGVGNMKLRNVSFSEVIGDQRCVVFFLRRFG